MAEPGSGPRVLHLMKTSLGGDWALRQMRELVSAGCEVHVALPDERGLAGLYREAGIKIHVLDCDLALRRPWRLPWRLRSIRRLVDQVAPDLLHSHFVGTTVAARLALGARRSPLRLFQVSGPLHLEHRLTRWLELYTANESDTWVASCRATRELYVASGIPGARVHLSYHGLDIPSSFPSYSGDLRRELGIPKSRKMVGMIAYVYGPRPYLGRWRGVKGHEDLIDALALCRQRGIDEVQGVFVGGAWGKAWRYEKRIHARARRKLGAAAIFLGTRNDVASLYSQLDVAVHPSLSENVGGAGESLLAGVPTVATNVGGLPDFVVPGRTGWLVPPRNPAALAEAIAEALANPGEARQRALMGRRLVTEKMDVRRTAREILSIYHRLLGRDVG